MRTGISNTEIDINQLFIDEKTLPKARKRESGEMVTSRKEIMDKLRTHWIQITRSKRTEIFTILEKSNYATLSSENNASTTILITPEWIQYFITLVNWVIQDIWDNSETNIKTPSRQYQIKNQQAEQIKNQPPQLHLQW